MSVWVFRGSEADSRVLKYLKDYRELVYWNTPKLRSEIAIGDTAYFWRSKRGSNLPNGIIASGFVVEEPKPKEKVKHPERIRDDLWISHEQATKPANDWLTGIRVEILCPTFGAGMLLSDTVAQAIPTLLPLRQPNTVVRVRLDEQAPLARLWRAKARRRGQSAVR